MILDNHQQVLQKQGPIQAPARPLEEITSKPEGEATCSDVLGLG